jgi:hypothetical protein
VFDEASCAVDGGRSRGANSPKTCENALFRLAGLLPARVYWSELVMNYKKLVVAFGLVVAVAAMAAPAQAQIRARGGIVVGQAVPRAAAAPFIARPGIGGVAAYRPHVWPGVNPAFYYGYPYYGPYVGYGSPYAYSYPYPYAYSYPYGYGYAYPYGVGYSYGLGYPSRGLGFVARGPVGAYGARIAPARRVGVR